MQTESAEGDAAVAATLKRRPWWWILAGVFLLAAGIILHLWFGEVEPAFRKIGTLMVCVAAAGLSAVWFLLFSGLGWRTRLVRFAAGAVSVASFLSLVRVREYSGDVFPHLTWRWTPTKDTTLPASAVRPGDALTEVDLTHTTPQDFPRFLGHEGRAAVNDISLDRNWATRPPRQVWKQPIGAGWSAFSVVGPFAVTQEQRGEFELVVCYEVTTGRVLWEHRDQVRFSESLGGDGPRATPTIVDGRVYTMGATGILNCLDGATGKPVWSRDVLKEHDQNNLEWAKSCSPLVYDDFVVVTLGDSREPSLVAYRRDNGEMVWQAGRDRTSYATPVLATLASQRQLVVVNAASVSGHDPASGELLWEYGWPGEFAKCSQPVPLDGDRVFVSAGYGIGCAMLQIESGDGKFSVKELWNKKQMKTRFTNVVVRDHFAYGLDDGILACVDLRTGERTWKAGRYNQGQVLFAGDLLIVVTEHGELVLVDANPRQPLELGRFAAITGKTWNNPALAGRFLLVRNAEEAACFELQ